MVHKTSPFKIKDGMLLLTQEDLKRLPPLYSTEKIPIEEKVLQVKFFSPDSNWTWYAVEFDGKDRFFGYVKGFENEWGYFSMKELMASKGTLGLHIERDRYFTPTRFKDLKEFD